MFSLAILRFTELLSNSAQVCLTDTEGFLQLSKGQWIMTKYVYDYNMTRMVLAGNEINFAKAAGLIRLHMPSVKKYRV